MALNTKGVTLRLSNSTDLTVFASSVLRTADSGSSHNFIRIQSLDTNVFAPDGLGLTTGMRIVTNDTGATSVYTIADVQPTQLALKVSSRDVFVENLTSTSLSFIAYHMEEIGEIISIDGPSGSVNVIDITNLGSTAREKLVGIQDEGQVSMEVFMNPTTISTAINQWKLRDLRQAGTESFFDIRFTDHPVGSTSEPSAYFFEGFVTNFTPGVALDDAVKVSIGLEISSQAHFINSVTRT